MMWRRAAVFRSKWLYIMIVSMLLAVWAFDCHLDGRNDHSHTRQVNRFGFALENFGDTHGTLPGPTLDDAVEQLESFEKTSKQNFNLNWNDYRRNKSVWGGRFVYERISPTRAQFRSTGPNKRDDHGSGDDLQVEVEIVESVKHPGD